jgi:hypothetical protein
VSMGWFSVVSGLHFHSGVGEEGVGLRFGWRAETRDESKREWFQEGRYWTSDTQKEPVSVWR